MVKNNLSYLILASILIICGLIYVYKLGAIPSGFYVDEAVVAYNAYSVLETGKDAFGQPYPVLFRLLGSYTPPLFVYLSSIAIRFYGMQVETFRMLSVISALISVVFFYLLIKNINIFSSRYSILITTFFYSISPWLVFNARIGYEVTLAYTLFNIGVYFLFKALDKPKYFLYSFSFFSLATYTAHTQRFLVPIFCVLFFLIFRKIILKKTNYKHLLGALAATLILQIPHLMVITTPAFWVKNQRLLEGGRVLHNILTQSFSYSSTKNLFFELTDIDLQHTIPAISVMYNWMVIPFLIGLFFLVYRIKERGFKFLVILFIASLIPAVLSGEFISIQRALPFLLPLMIIIGLGIDVLFQKFRVLSFFAVVFLIPISLVLLYRSYFILFPVERAEGWNYGYEKLANFIRSNMDKQFMVDNSRNPRNYILLLYHLKYPPAVYQNEVNPKYKNGYYHSLPPENSYNFGNIQVREVDWKIDSYKKQIIVGDPLSVSESQAKDHFLEKIGDIKNPVNNPILIFYKTNPQKKCKQNYSEVFCGI